MATLPEPEGRVLLNEEMNLIIVRNHSKMVKFWLGRRTITSPKKP
jgi:hypothetical protein